MALELSLSYSISTDRKTLYITDDTGEYNSVNNTGGWGVGDPPTVSSPTPYLKDIDYAVLEITDDSGSGTTYDIDIISDLSITFSGSLLLSELVYTISNTYLGLAAASEIPDGVYKVEYKVSDGGAYATGNYANVIKYIGIYAQIENKVNQLIKDIYLYYITDSCDNSYVSNMNTIYMLFQNLKYSAEAGDMTAFNNILDTLNDFKEIQDCSS